jgi:predicted metal-dependent hydrolase
MNLAEHIHKKDAALFAYVVTAMKVYADKFQLPLVSIKPLERKNCARYFGRCSTGGKIRVRVRDARKDGGGWKGRDEPYQIIDTMAHELAHLRTVEHTEEWFNLHTQILWAMRDDGVFTALTILCQ